MKSTKKLLLLAVAVLSLTSCAKIFYSPDAVSLANKQEVVAILPPKVTIAARKKVDADAIIEQQKRESINFQNEIYSWLLKRKMQGKIDKEIQQLTTTNALLKKAGYPENPLTISEICEVLGVDGTLSSNFSLSRPMSDGAAIALTLIGFGGNTNEVGTTLSINDCENKKLIWNYEHKISGGLGSTHSRIVNQLMRKSSKKMPYQKQ
ncbi:hypothetical protein [Psychroflexus planctonicus]|uniref:Lipoprotein n=1 Tax=Psychroflexus planctonicus TaxID=1526575 RepID=A0ABQ1SEN0_9FLAO|nr:hypothetical protein [Psychroflexus planctonicus]GGE31618.1 hypothetical protein GCM10010832_09940 [Psychroflexus planctonicus]